jgi:hypothetical protein
MSEKELAAPKGGSRSTLTLTLLCTNSSSLPERPRWLSRRPCSRNAEQLADLIVKNKGLSSKGPALGELGAKLAVRHVQQLQAVASSASSAATGSNSDSAAADESNAAVSDSNSRSATSAATYSSTAASSSSFSSARGENAAAAAGETNQMPPSLQSRAEPRAEVS